MKNRLIITGILMACTLLFACKDNTAFTVSGTLKNASKLKTIYLRQADSTSRFQTVDSAGIGPDGSYKFRHQSGYANLYQLEADTVRITFIAQNGDAVELDANLGAGHNAYTVKGSEASARIKAFDELSVASATANNKVIAEFQARSQMAGAQPDSLLKVYMPIFQRNLAAYSDKVLRFIGENKNSLAAFYASSALDAVRYEPQLIAYADGIDAELARNPAVQNFIRAENKAKPLAIGHQAPEFTINDGNGKPVNLSDYKGKYVMLDFWASWCVPCRQENPNVLKQYNALKGKGFNVLGISLDKDKAAWQKAVNDDRLAWTQTSDLQSFEGKVETLYHIEAIPSNFIIDPQGNIIAKNIRGAELEAFLRKTIH